MNSAGARPFGLFERVLAGRYLRARRAHGGVALISIISFVGIMLAVAVLIITMSVMNGFREELLSRILGFSGHVFVDVSAEPPEEVDRIAQRVAGTSGVVHVSRLVEGQALASNGPAAAGVMVRGAAPDELRALSLVADNVRDGSLADFGVDPLTGEASIALAQGLASRLGVGVGSGVTLISPQGSATPFGFTPRRKTYVVAAIFAVGHNEYDQVFAFMPLEEAQLFFGREGRVDTLEVRIAEPDETRPVKLAIREAIGPLPIIYDWQDLNAQLVGALIVERNVMRLILMMIVAIAAMNIISGLVMLVKNKGRDIAILRTMGATRGAILRIFFMAGAAVGVAGALAGLTFGVLFCLFIGPIQDFLSAVIGFDIFPGNVYALDGLPARVEWGEVALVTGWALLMSFLATLPPAWRASRLDPVEALRYE